MEQMLALFPLHRVLFPGALLPLHIFEPRYRQMINRCLQLKQPFGVVLIREGEEVASNDRALPLEPHDVGTTAVIQNVLKFPDGRMLLAAQGEQRFRIEHIVQREPYMVAVVTMLDEEFSPDAGMVAEQIRTLYIKHCEALTHATGVTQQMEDLPDDPVAVSYHLSDKFRVVNCSKQELLEADLDDRLAAIVDALDRELRLLPHPPRVPPPVNEGPWTLN